MIETTTSDIVNVSTQAGQTLTDALNSIAVGLAPADRAKLDGIEPGATANSPDVQLRDRSTHTGTQLASTVSDFAATVRSTTAAQLVAGANTTITQVGDTLVLASAAGAGSAVTSVAGKTGSVTLEKADVGLTNVDNTADVDKPVSTATAIALAGKQATLVSGTNIKTVNNAALTGSGNVSIAGGNATANLGYLGIPQNSRSAAYTLVLADAGKHLLHPSADTTARVFTIPANSSVAFPVGTVVTFVNQNEGGAITISITTDTMRLAGPGTTGSRTLAANGIATAIKLTPTEWLISGVGLT